MERTTKPKCPECYGRTRKFGFVITRKGKKQRHQCVECGRSFTEKVVIQNGS